MILLKHYKFIVYLVGCCLFYSSYAPASEPKAQPVVYILHSPFSLESKFVKLSQWSQDHHVTVKAWPVTDNAGLPADLDQASLIIVDAIRSIDLVQLHQHLDPYLKQTQIPWISLNKQSANIEQTIATTMLGYYKNGGEQNYHHLFDYVYRYFNRGDSQVIYPIKLLPVSGFYHPDAPDVFDNIDQLMAWKQQTASADLTNVLFTIHSNLISDSELKTIEYIAQQAKLKGIFPLFYWYDHQVQQAFVPLFNAYPIDAIVNTQHMQNLEQRKLEFAQINVPVLQALNYRFGDIFTWQHSVSGISPQMTAVLMTIPETAGLSDPLVISAIENGEIVPIAEQIDGLLDKLVRLSKLKNMPNIDKRLALLFWNHPDGQNNISASYLNVPKSIVEMMQAFQRAGYTISRADEQTLIAQAQKLLLGYYDNTTLDELLAQDLADKVPLSVYQHYLDSLPSQHKALMIKTWGEPQKHWAYRTADEGYFIIPRAMFGHLMIMPQPPRAGSPEAHYHDTTLPPDHIYLLGYLYLRMQFNADAIIHLGTHGTQEWLPGKDRGLSINDFALLPIADLPVFYPYIQDNISEALQVKRRGRGITISHQTPVFAPAGLYEELKDINQVLNEYQQIDEGMVKEQLKHKINQLVFAPSLNIGQDLGWQEHDTLAHYDAFLADLHEYLEQIAAKAIPLGLHTFGQANDGDLRLITVLMQLGEEYYSLFATHRNDLFALDIERLKQQPAYLSLKHYLHQGGQIDQVSDPLLQAQLMKAQQYEGNLANIDEMSALLNGLSGGFVPACRGGDPLRNPDLINGCNLYAFEADKVPTQSAYETGKQAFEQLIENYQQNHDGMLPNKLAFSLWSSEAIRHFGVTESQILHALGLRPVWERNGRVSKLEIIPSNELDHPRIDVVIQVTGVYRDQFDVFMRLLAKAIDELAHYDEADNPIRQHSQQLARQLIDQGVPSQHADEYAQLRIFGGQMGSYGTAVTDLTLDSQHWDNDHVIAEQYLSSLQYGYGAADDSWQVALNNVNLYSEQLKGVDVAVLARSTHLNGVLSTDHPFEFLGGLSLAVEYLNGQAPDLYISDLRQKQPKTVKLDKFLATELRAQYFNPQWISEMKKEGYAGTLSILNMANNLWGWQVMNQSAVRDDQWQTLHEVFIKDKYNLELNQWYEQHNPSAQLQLVERMVEAIRKDYWHADEQTKRELVERWQLLTAQVSLVDKHQVTRQYIEQLAAGFGLQQANQSSPPILRGQVLAQVSEQPSTPNQAITYPLIGLLLILSCFLSGMIYQITRNVRT